MDLFLIIYEDCHSTCRYIWFYILQFKWIDVSVLLWTLCAELLRKDHISGMMALCVVTYYISLQKQLLCPCLPYPPCINPSFMNIFIHKNNKFGTYVHLNWLQNPWVQVDVIDEAVTVNHHQLQQPHTHTHKNYRSRMI